MALTANWFFEVAVVDGHKVSAGGVVNPDAIDFFRVDIAAGDTEDIDLLPATAAGKVNLLIVRPAQLSEDVSFAFEDLTSTPAPDAYSLEAPVVLVGAGAVGLLPSPPIKLWFKNDTADPVAVEILIGRDATP